MDGGGVFPLSAVETRVVESRVGTRFLRGCGARVSLVVTTGTNPLHAEFALQIWKRKGQEASSLIPSTPFSHVYARSRFRHMI